MKITEDKFIELLRKSDSFLIREAFSKVKNANVIAVFPKIKGDENSVIFQDPRDNKIYYASYALNDDTVVLEDIEKMEFENRDYRNEMREHVENLFSKNYDEHLSQLKSTIGDIINENDEVENRIRRKIDELMKQEIITHRVEPKFKVRNGGKLREGLEKLREDKFFGKFLVEAEGKSKVPVILEEIDWSKDSGKIFRRKINYDGHAAITEGYTKRGFKKTSLLAREYWKDQSFRKRIRELLEAEDFEKTSTVFCEFYKNITLLSEEELGEMLSKTLLSVYSDPKIDDKMKKIYEAIDANKERMLRWELLQEQPPMAAEPPPRGTQAGEVPPEAIEATEGEPGVPGTEEPTTEPAGLDVSPDELPDADEGLPGEEDLATEATEEVKIINALLDVVEDVFWNGNQENKELANLIKEIRDMRASGSFDEDRLSEIFRDLFAVTQQIATSPEEEVPGGEELPPEEAGEGIPPAGAEAPTEAPAAAPEAAAEPSPLETYV